MTPTVGSWYCLCCWEDLHEIRDETDLAEVLELLADEEDCSDVQIWDTKDQALRELSAGESADVLARIKEMHGWEPGKEG